MFTLPNDVKVLNLPEQVEKNREDIASVSSRLTGVDAHVSDLGQQIKIHDVDIDQLKTNTSTTGGVIVTGSISAQTRSTFGDIESTGKLILSSADAVVDKAGNKLIASADLADFKANYFNTEAHYKYANCYLQRWEENSTTPFDGYYTDISQMYSHAHFVNGDDLSTASIPNYPSATVGEGLLEAAECTDIALGSFAESGIDLIWAFGRCKCTKVTIKDGCKVYPTNFSYAFSGDPNLEEVGAFDLSKCTMMNCPFDFCPKLKHIHCRHFRMSFDISASTAFEQSDLVEIISNLDPVSTPQTLTMGATNLAKLTQDQILVATGKGWTLA